MRCVLIVNRLACERLVSAHIVGVFKLRVGQENVSSIGRWPIVYRGLDPEVALPNAIGDCDDAVCTALPVVLRSLGPGTAEESRWTESILGRG